MFQISFIICFWVINGTKGKKIGLNPRRSFSLWSDVLYDFLLLVPFSRIYTSFYVQKVAKIEFSPICNASSSFPEYLDIKKGKKSKGKGKIVDLKIASSKRHLLVGKMTILGQDSHSWLLSGFLNHCNCAKGNHDFLLRIRASSSDKGVKQGKYRYPSHPWNKQTTILA